MGRRTGENSNEWFVAAVQGLNAQNIGWCHWTLKRVDGPTSLLRVKPYGSILTPQGRAALLRNVQYVNCQPNRDVIAALTQPATFQAPFAALSIPGTIQAADYDLGREGVAYHDEFSAKVDYRDNTPWNQGGAYRNDGVDVERNVTSPAFAYSLGHLAAGEWLKYTVNVASAGEYTLQLRVQKGAAPGLVSLQLDGSKFVSVPVAAGATVGEWATVAVKTPRMPAGQHQLQLLIEQPIGQISWMHFEAAGAASAGGQ